MRIRFELNDLEAFYFEFKGEKYAFSSLKPLARKERLATNIREYIYELPIGDFVYLTVVGDEDQTSGLGVAKGWYVVEELNLEEAKNSIDALAKFTVMYD